MGPTSLEPLQAARGLLKKAAMPKENLCGVARWFVGLAIDSTTNGYRVRVGKMDFADARKDAQRGKIPTRASGRRPVKPCTARRLPSSRPILCSGLGTGSATLESLFRST